MLLAWLSPPRCGFTLRPLRGRSEEAWILADKVALALDRQLFLLTPHQMTDLVVMQQASVVEIGLQQESIAIDIATTLLSGD